MRPTTMTTIPRRSMPVSNTIWRDAGAPRTGRNRYPAQSRNYRRSFPVCTLEDWCGLEKMYRGVSCVDFSTFCQKHGNNSTNTLPVPAASRTSWGKGLRSCIFICLGLNMGRREKKKASAPAETELKYKEVIQALIDFEHRLAHLRANSRRGCLILQGLYNELKNT